MKLVKNKPLKLNNREERIVHAMHLLGDPTRYKIYKILKSKKELCVSEIAEKIDVSTPAVSQHFKMFELAGLVNKNRNGQKICYSLNTDNTITRLMTELV